MDLSWGASESRVGFGEGMLRRTISSYLGHYHAERNHQALENRLIEPGNEVGRAVGMIRCRQHPGGMLRYYNRGAA
jgi:hypothetical protein